MRTISDILAELDEGQTAERATALLAEVVQAVMETGKKGRLTISLAVSKQNKMAMLKADIKATKPEPATEASMFFVDDEGALRRDDPRQQKLRNVELAPPTPLRSGKE